MTQNKQIGFSAVLTAEFHHHKLSIYRQGESTYERLRWSMFHFSKQISSFFCQIRSTSFYFPIFLH